MKTFEQLYREITENAMQNNLRHALEELKNEDYDKNQLKCLVHPDKFAPVWKRGECTCKDRKCIASCLFSAITEENGKIIFNKELCVGCGECLKACDENNLILSKDTFSAIEILKESEVPVYALIAPAYIGQFGDEVLAGQVRSALKHLGFAGMIEVAAFADILTFKEALEFNKNIKNIDDFQLTSCCCPIWIALIRKSYMTLAEHLPASVSPMIAAGRIIKKLFPESKTIFIGPCVAKKAEAREADIRGVIDVVITFEELRDIFNAAGIDPQNEENEVQEHSSFAGRIYAKAGGVSTAVKASVERLRQNDKPEIKVCHSCGVKKCKELLDDIVAGKINYNFYEGMGCEGGCVGGPKVIRSREATSKTIEEYAKESEYKSPIDNPYVIDLLHRLGFEMINDFIENSDILTRDFSQDK